TGQTGSRDFPTANPLQQYAGVFVTRLRADGSALVFSTYLGSIGDRGNGIAVDPTTGDAVVTGGDSDVFVARLRADGSALVYSIYLGGSNDDIGIGIAVDPTTGDALVTGVTVSPNFPTTPGAFQRTCGTDGNCNGYYDPVSGEYIYVSDAFVSRI